MKFDWRRLSQRVVDMRRRPILVNGTGFASVKCHNQILTRKGALDFDKITVEEYNVI